MFLVRGERESEGPVHGTSTYAFGDEKGATQDPAEQAQRQSRGSHGRSVPDMQRIPQQSTDKTKRRVFSINHCSVASAKASSAAEWRLCKSEAGARLPVMGLGNRQRQEYVSGVKARQRIKGA